jgi:hypothetical protein
VKLERWGSLLVQEKYQEEKAYDKRHPDDDDDNDNNNNNNNNLDKNIGTQHLIKLVYCLLYSHREIL